MHVFRIPGCADFSSARSCTGKHASSRSLQLLDICSDSLSLYCCGHRCFNMPTTRGDGHLAPRSCHVTPRAPATSHFDYSFTILSSYYLLVDRGHCAARAFCLFELFYLRYVLNPGLPRTPALFCVVQSYFTYPGLAGRDMLDSNPSCVQRVATANDVVDQTSTCPRPRPTPRSSNATTYTRALQLYTASTCCSVSYER